VYELIDRSGSRRRGLFRRADRQCDAGLAIPVIVSEPGHAAGLDALYQTSYKSMYAYLRSRTTGDEEAADLTQQVYLQVLRAWECRPSDPAALLPWLFRIARNAATDLHRRRRESIPWEMLPVAFHPCSSEPAEAELVRREVLAHLAEVVAALPPPKRDLLALRFAACLSYAEIGAVIGKREGTVKKEMSRLLKHLREQQDED
jgi:RNA polymerase sigma-70 factor (ECF subfamily)